MRRTAASISGRTPAKPWPDHGPSTPPPLRASNFFEARMIVGVPKEIKDNEARVGVTPAGAKALIEAGHTVLVQTQAGAQSGFPDAEYQNAGAEIVGEPGWVWGKSELVVKVKEPIEPEYVFFRQGWSCSPISISRPCPR